MPWRSSRHRRQRRAAKELLLTGAVVLVFGSVGIWFVMKTGYTGSSRGTGGVASLAPVVVLTAPSATTALSPRPAASAEPSAATSPRASSTSSADAAPATPIEAPERN